MTGVDRRRLADVTDLLADDIEDMRINGYQIGTQLVTRVKAIARQVRAALAPQPNASEQVAVLLVQYAQEVLAADGIFSTERTAKYVAAIAAARPTGESRTEWGVQSEPVSGRTPPVARSASRWQAETAVGGAPGRVLVERDVHYGPWRNTHTMQGAQG